MLQKLENTPNGAGGRKKRKAGPLEWQRVTALRLPELTYVLGRSLKLRFLKVVAS